MGDLPDDWRSGYVDAFHAERPGVTERVLSRARSDGLDPYAWCAAGLGPVAGGAVVDVACGSGPLAPHLEGWLGLDLSAAELLCAAAAGRGPLIRATGEQLPLPGGAVSSVACSMSLHVMEPLGEVLAEIGRVLRPGGRAVALLPSGRPAGWADTLIYLRLSLALRRRIEYPNDGRLRPASLASLAAAGGLTVLTDDHQAFALLLRSEADVDELLSSLYLPGVEPSRLRAGRRVLLRKVGGDLGVPLRRIVLERSATR